MCLRLTWKPFQLSYPCWNMSNFIQLIFCIVYIWQRRDLACIHFISRARADFFRDQLRFASGRRVYKWKGNSRSLVRSLSPQSSSLSRKKYTHGNNSLISYSFSAARSTAERNAHIRRMRRARKIHKETGWNRAPYYYITAHTREAAALIVPQYANHIRVACIIRIRVTATLAFMGASLGRRLSRKCARVS